jgi:hypothetical protein
MKPRRSLDGGALFLFGGPLKHYVSKEVTCPFYTQETPLTIYCEGAVPDATSTKTTFGSRRGLITHKHNFCNMIHSNADCPIYRSINLKY